MHRLTDIDNSESAVLLLPHHLPGGLEGEPHRHDRGQLIYPQKGRFRLWAGDRIWTGSRQQAMWVPPGILHSVKTLDDMFVHNVYVNTDLVPGFPDHCKIIQVSPLLRELLAYGLTLPRTYEHVTEHVRTMLAITDQIRLADDLVDIHLPVPQDRRLKVITDHLMENPDDNRCLEEWAKTAHASTRTLARLFVSETGMTFRQWRQHLRIAEAITRLSEGHSVLTVSMDLGYASQSAFTTMFRKLVGRTPSDFHPKGLNAEMRVPVETLP